MLILTYPQGFGDERDNITPTLTETNDPENREYKVTRISPSEGYIEISIMVPKWELKICDLRKGDEL